MAAKKDSRDQIFFLPENKSLTDVPSTIVGATRRGPDGPVKNEIISAGLFMVLVVANLGNRCFPECKMVDKFLDWKCREVIS